MSKWEMVKLGDICDVRDGTHDSPEYIMNGYPLITSKDVTNGFIDFTDVNYISEKDYAKINLRSFVDNGDILMPMIGTIGKPIIVEKLNDFAIKNLALIKFNNLNVLNKYILYVLQSEIFLKYLQIKNRGGTQKFISLGDIRNFYVPLPPLNLQKQMATTLDSIMEIINLRKQRLAELDNLIKSVFYDMFGDLTKNENGWDIKSLQQLIDEKYIIGHLDGNHGSLYPRIEEFSSSGIAYIGASSINDKRIDFEKVKYLPIERALKFKKGIAVDGDVLFAHNATVGPVAVLHIQEKYAILSTSLTYYRCNMNKLNNYYLMEYMNSPFFVGQYLKTMSQTTRNQVPITKQRTFYHVIPPVNLQNCFSTVINKIEEQKSELKKSIKESQLLFDSLMSRYFE